jgi:hypothetical protein
MFKGDKPAGKTNLIGMAFIFGSVGGIVLGIAFDNLAMGVAFGSGGGLMIGAVISTRK